MLELVDLPEERTWLISGAVRLGGVGVRQGFSLPVVALMDLCESKIKMNAWTLPFPPLANSLETLTICCSDRLGREGQQKALTKIMEPPACELLTGLPRQTGC